MTDTSQDVSLGELIPGTEFIAAGLARACDLIARRDAAIDSQSPFDRAARIGLPQAKYDVSVDMYLDYLTTQMMAWDAHEITALKAIREALVPVFAGIDVSLPAQIYLIKTTGREEAAAAYTRHHNTICLPSNMVASINAVPVGGDPLHSGPSTDYLAGIVTHEMFHIMSKNNPDWRETLYELVTYEMISNPVAIPHDIMPCGLPMSALKITNPDAPVPNVKIDMVPPGGEAEVAMTPILISSQPYSTGEFFQTLQWLFLQIEQSSDGQWSAARKEGAAIWYSASDAKIKAQYMERIGGNLSGELFHPDEIMAQSFVIAAKEPSLGLLKKISDDIWLQPR